MARAFSSSISAPFIEGHADDVFGMIAEEQALAPAFRMRSDDGMVHRRFREPLRLGQWIFPVTPVAREIQVVHGAQTREARLPPRIRAVVGAIHVAKMRLPAALRHDLAVNDRRLDGGRSA